MLTGSSLRVISAVVKKLQNQIGVPATLHLLQPSLDLDNGDDDGDGDGDDDDGDGDGDGDDGDNGDG